ncbi:hypothetical protein [Lysobacter sp. 22409]|uniref:hypothetical protein n=1 Tax=Lysobacter sp. 22409 TaxID=3453917 RepID=UPI003F842BDD
MQIIDDALRPPEPQLLDTSVLQNLDWVDRKIDAGEGQWTEQAEQELQHRFGVDHATDLLNLGSLYERFKWDGSYPWTVCKVAFDEALPLGGEKGAGLSQIVQFLYDHQCDWDGDAYPGIAKGVLQNMYQARVSPLVLKSLGVESAEEVAFPQGPLSFLPDLGDRLMAAHALLANIPAILTTDRRTFWKHRSRLRDLGVQVMRPSELLNLYEPYWAALDAEFERRRRHQR